jgi:hypothetical protein
MDTFEAKNLLEESVRCVARTMEQIRLREIEKIEGYDEPMQDHLAECTWAEVPHDETSFEDCLKYLERLHEGFRIAAEHEDLAWEIAKKNKYDFNLTHIADMVMGMVGHGFPDYLVECAKEINAEAKKVLPSGKFVRSKKGCEKVLDKFVPKAADIIKKHHLQTWEDGHYSLPLGYLQSWMARNYWRE